MSIIEPINNAEELFELKEGNQITKGNLFDLIQYSKVKTSNFWIGEDYKINNTPMQGINWIGTNPFIKAVIIKTKNGAYNQDGWIDNDKQQYRYSLKKRKDRIDYEENANSVLINQIRYSYPILLFIENKTNWIFEGRFKVKKNEKESVLLSKIEKISNDYLIDNQEDLIFKEGSVKYITHLNRERNRNAIEIVKQLNFWICDICSLNFVSRYGEDYIEAHHKTQISDFNTEHEITLKDIVLLCPNCHKAVHLYMKKDDNMKYKKIKRIIQDLDKKAPNKV